MESGIRLLKLITGETIIADVELDKLKKNATLKQPLIFSILNRSDGSVSMMATKWVESMFTTHRIKTYHIVANVMPSESMHQLYNESIEDLENSSYDFNEEQQTKQDEFDELVDYMSDIISDPNTVH
tara:strand:- start:205 stop:585 length:381 start_codon:yes stop_codon:yes gene_type:complete